MLYCGNEENYQSISLGVKTISLCTFGPFSTVPTLCTLGFWIQAECKYQSLFHSDLNFVRRITDGDESSCYEGGMRACFPAFTRLCTWNSFRRVTLSMHSAVCWPSVGNRSDGEHTCQHMLILSALKGHTGGAPPCPAEAKIQGSRMGLPGRHLYITAALKPVRRCTSR